jgi:opacity protein-like surface antigen
MNKLAATAALLAMAGWAAAAQDAGAGGFHTHGDGSSTQGFSSDHGQDGFHQHTTNPLFKPQRNRRVLPSQLGGPATGGFHSHGDGSAASGFPSDRSHGQSGFHQHTSNPPFKPQRNRAAIPSRTLKTDMDPCHLRQCATPGLLDGGPGVAPNRPATAGTPLAPPAPVAPSAPLAPSAMPALSLSPVAPALVAPPPHQSK